MRWITTTPTEAWAERIPATGVAPALTLTGETFQTWDGFGGCFNELGAIALAGLPEAKQAEVYRALFDPHAACRFTLCRLPIGASDYGAEWYSHNETDGDFAMAHFSIARDRQHLLPYILRAKALQPALRLFASPWSPPTWMKRPKAYNYGTLIKEPRHLEAYARYFLNFVQAYREAGAPIAQVHVQNEPCADQKFPSCLWTGAEMRDFIRDYLGPCFRDAGEACEIWLGTLNTDDYDGYPHTVLSDPATAAFTAGVGFQWAGKGVVQRTAMSWPGVKLMQTENECGDGRNTWEYARYVFGLLWHYLTNGVHAYIYWNMVLAPGGESTWGWHQNAMITADPATGTVTYNPEFYVMQHFAHAIVPGAVRLGVAGPWAGNAVAFRNPDGTTVVVVMNPFPTPRTLALNGTVAELAGHSFNTFVL
jgi:glucosylceramidase